MVGRGQVPDYNRVVPKNHKNAVTLGRAPLQASLQRTAILTSEKFKGVRLNIEPGTLRVASNSAEQEEAVDELEIDDGGDAPREPSSSPRRRGPRALRPRP